MGLPLYLRCSVGGRAGAGAGAGGEGGGGGLSKLRIRGVSLYLSTVPVITYFVLFKLRWSNRRHICSLLSIRLRLYPRCRHQCVSKSALGAASLCIFPPSSSLRPHSGSSVSSAAEKHALIPAETQLQVGPPSAAGLRPVLAQLWRCLLRLLH